MRPAAPGREERGSPSVRAVSVVLVYAAFAALWILLSDKAVQALFNDPGQMALASTLKGWLFVAVTSVLLYVLIRRLVQHGGVAAVAGAPPLPVRGVLLPLVLMAAAILALTAIGITENIAHQKSREVARLQVIAELQSGRIEEWLGERWADVQFLHTSSFLAGRYLAWRKTRDLAALGVLLNRLEEFGSNYGYREVLLVEDGEVTGRAPGTRVPAGATAAMPDSGRLMVGPYLDGDGRVMLDFVTALAGTTARIVLRFEPAKSIYPSRLVWPIPSETGESLLFRRDGEHVLFLNQLRHRPDSALKLRLPLADQEVLAVQILQGRGQPGQAIEGIDYRREAVIGVAQPVSGTDWFLVAKLDRREVFAEAMRDVVWIGMAGFLALFVAASASYIFRQRQHLAATLREREAAAEQLRVLSLLDAVLASSTDAIFAKDMEGRYLLFNHEAARLTGKATMDVLGRDDTVLFPPEQAALVMENDRKVMAKGRTVSFTERLPTTGGETVFLATKGPLRDATGKTIGLFGISRDITERAGVEDTLRRNNEELQRFNAAMVGRELEMVELKRQINALAQELGRVPPYDLTGMVPSDTKRQP